MEIRNLITFLKVTELKSFSKAAEALDYSQSAVTVQIQQLERELGVQLFDRIGKNVSITQYGKDFVSYARDVVSAVARASAFATANEDLTGTVRVGTLDSLMTASFADIVPRFHKRFPHVLTNIHGDNVAHLRELLVKNELDLIYTLDEQVHDTQFVKVFEAEEDIVVVANAKNPLTARDDVKLADLVKHPFVLMNRNNAYRDQFDLELARHGLSVEPFCELESDVLALRLLSEDARYLSVLPRYTVQKSIHEHDLAIIPVQDCAMRQWRQLMYHKNKVLTPQIQGMLDTILEIAKSPIE
ncbi:MAG: LysR family transcriptional regulator [Oscillospiraceae bacterium]|nr:LysR family transcriptional regulator [Oscillospiraceae bacterium]